MRWDRGESTIVDTLLRDKHLVHLHISSRTWDCYPMAGSLDHNCVAERRSWTLMDMVKTHEESCEAS